VKAGSYLVKGTVVEEGGRHPAQEDDGGGERRGSTS
jgi:hypothetical protein